MFLDMEMLKTEQRVFFMKKVVIHGFNGVAKRFAMRTRHVFNICAFVVRYNQHLDKAFDGIPVYSDFDSLPDKDIDYVFVMLPDYDGIRKEYEAILGEGSKTKLLSMLFGHRTEKQRQICAIANEVARKKVPGAVAELGVDYGDTAKYINLFFEDRRFYLFDTFGGFSEQDIQFEREQNTMNEKCVHAFDKRSSAAAVMKKMFYPEQCVIKAGIFPQSLDGLEDTFAFVHIDCDLSKPIYEGLQYFWPRLSIGGYICVHDYFEPLYTGVRQTLERFADAHGISVVPIVGNAGAVISKTR